MEAAIMIRQGKIADAKLIMRIIRDAVADMDSKGIFQWDSLYPNQAVVNHDLESGAMSVYEDEGIIKGMIVLNEQQDQEYQDLPWKFSFGKQLVVHRLCVDPCYQSEGIAGALMEFAEQTAKELEYQSIRLDTFVKNERACRFYRKLGYQVVGTVEFRKGTFYCLEKGMANLRLIKPNPDFEKEYSEMIDD
jgi:ribosomal protein S18 acetylase RimI-like enzyme